MDRPGHYRCDHCGSLFVHQDAKKAGGTGRSLSADGRPAKPIIGGAVLLVAVAVVASLFLVTESDPEPPSPPAPKVTSSGHEVREANAAKMEAAAAEREAAAAAAAEQPEPKPDAVPDNVDHILNPELVTAAPEPEPEPEPIRIEAYQPLSGCECKADLDGDGKREAIQLALKASVVGTWITSSGTSREVAYDFIVRPKKKGEPFRLPLEKQTAPPRRRRGEVMDVGVACETDRMIVAAGQHVTAWSLRSQSAEWTTELPASFIKKGSRPPTTGPTIHCAKMRVRKGAVTVQLPGGTVALSTDTGAES